MQQRRPNRLRVTDDDNRRTGFNAAKLFQMPYDALLQGSHALSPGRAACTASRIPPAPARIAFQICKGKRGPFAIIDLVDRRDDLNGKSEVPGEDGGRLLSATLRARLYCRGRSADQLGAASHLPTAAIVKLHTRHPTAEPAAEHGVMAMTHEMDGLHHGSLKLHPR